MYNAMNEVQFSPRGENKNDSELLQTSVTSFVVWGVDSEGALQKFEFSLKIIVVDSRPCCSRNMINVSGEKPSKCSALSHDVKEKVV